MSSSAQREPPTGEQFVIEREGQQAVVTEVGATLRSWRVDGREQLDTFGVADAGAGFRGKVLLPWPNRIRDARYVFRGVEHGMAISEPERNCALHGLVLWVNWRALRRARDRVTLGYVLHPQPGYPFTLGLEVEYGLTAEGLEVALRVENLGAGEAPFGAGFHPYLAVPDAVLRVPGRTRVPVDDERLLPVGPPVGVEGTDYDFREPRPIGGRALDTCFGDLERGADGVARVRVATAKGRGVTVWMDEGFRYVHVFTDDGDGVVTRERGGVAIEPTTCAPDAFNSGEGLETLAPGASFAGRWGLSPRWEE